MNLTDQLILERDIKQQQDEKSRNEDILGRQKRELLAAMDLVKKESEKLTGLRTEQIKVMDDVHKEKVTWAAEKRLQEDTLKEAELKALKVINREEFVKLQEQKLQQRENALIERENQVSEKEKGFADREEEIQTKEQKAHKFITQSEQHLEKAKIQVETIRQKILADINNW